MVPFLLIIIIVLMIGVGTVLKLALAAFVGATVLSIVFLPLILAIGLGVALWIAWCRLKTTEAHPLFFPSPFRRR